MSTVKTILPDFVIANLYGNNLVVGNDVVGRERPKQIFVDKTVEPLVEKQVENITAAPVKQTASIPEAQETSSVQTSISETPKQWFLGNNGKQITLMVKEESVPYINDKHLQFLSNVLSACKLNLGDIALVNYNNFPLGFEELKTKSNPKIVLAFDLSTKELKLPFTIPLYQVQDYAQCRFLFAPSLSKMEGDHADAKAEKTKLWNSLKTLFGL